MEVALKKTPWWFWGVCIVFILLNLVACWGYWTEMTLPDEAYLKAYGAEMAQLRGQMPWWSTSGLSDGRSILSM